MEQEEEAKEEVEFTLCCKRGCCPKVRKVDGGILIYDDAEVYLTFAQLAELKRLIREGRI